MLTLGYWVAFLGYWVACLPLGRHVSNLRHALRHAHIKTCPRKRGHGTQVGMAPINKVSSPLRRRGLSPVLITGVRSSVRDGSLDLQASKGGSRGRAEADSLSGGPWPG